MSRPVGTAKTGGRKRGTPNKDTVGLQAALESHGLDVIGQIAELLPQLTVDKRADILVNLMTYIYPKRKAIEQKLEIEVPEEPREATPEEIAERKARVQEQLRKLRILDGCTCPIVSEF